MFEKAFGSVNRVLGLFKVLNCKKKPSFDNVETPPFQMRLVLKEEAFELLKWIRDCDTDAELARQLDMTPPVVCELKKRIEHVSPELMGRIIVLLNAYDAAWWKLFEWVKIETYDGNSRKWNAEKSEGRMPYEHWLHEGIPENDVYTRPNHNYRANKKELVLVPGMNPKDKQMEIDRTEAILKKINEEESGFKIEIPHREVSQERVVKRRKIKSI